MQPLTLDAFIDYRFLSNVRLSPDGRQAALIVKTANLAENRYDSNLWLVRLGDGSLTQLTASGQDLDFAWLADSQHLLFISRRQEGEDKTDSTPFFKIAITGGEATPAFTIPMTVDVFRPLGDSRILFSTTVDLTAEPAAAGESHQDFVGRQERETEEKDYHVLDEIPFWHNGKGYANKKRTHLGLYDAAAEQVSRLTEGALQVEYFDLRGEQAVLAGVEFTDRQPLTNDLYRLDLATGELTRLTDGTREFGQPRFLNDWLVVSPGNDMQRHGLNQNEDLFALNPASGGLENLTPDWDQSFGNSVGSDCRLGTMEGCRADGGRFYFHTTERDSCYLNALSADGTLEQIIGRPGSIESFDVVGDAVVYIAFRGDKLQELYRWQDGREVQLTRLNEKPLQGITLSTPEHFTVLAADGTEIDAWMIRPVNWEAGKQYPSILEIHGGPKTVSSHTFFHEYQLLANQGYAVYFCNPRGSDGRGNSYADLRGKYGTVDYDDILAVVDHALAHYNWLDPQRMGVTGGSYGGFMTNWIIGHTGRFRAAVSQRSIANWTSFTLNSDIGYRFGPDQMAADPWDDPDKLWFHSPLKYADRVTTPTLFIHSSEDHRCWLPEGMQMFYALKYFGVEARMVVFDGETHELSRGGKPKHRIRRLQEILAWFDQHLKG